MTFLPHLCGFNLFTFHSIVASLDHFLALVCLFLVFGPGALPTECCEQQAGQRLLYDQIYNLYSLKGSEVHPSFATQGVTELLSGCLQAPGYGAALMSCL